MLDPAGGRVGLATIQAKHLGEESPDHLVAIADFLGELAAAVGQRDELVRLVVDQPSFCQRLKCGRHAGHANAKGLRDITHPGHTLSTHLEQHRLDIVFQRGAEPLVCRLCHLSPFVNSDRQEANA